MLQRIRVAALALVVGAGTLVLAPTAATAAQAPVLTRVRISPGSTIDVTSGAVKATFSFSTKGADKAELQLKPPGDVSVGTPITLTSTKRGDWTRWSGTKSFDSSNAGKWSWLAIAHGDGSPSRGGTFEVVVKKPVETSIPDFDARPDRADRGERIRVYGRLLAGGEAYGDQNVAITFRARGSSSYRTVATVKTRDSGRFSATVRAWQTGWWRAEFAATGAAKGSVSDSDRVDVRRHDRRSWISGFNARPEPVDQGDRLSFSGTLRVEDHGRVSGQRVAIYFRAENSARWRYVTSDVTDRHGRFWDSATARTSGWWRAEYAGARGVRGSDSYADWVTVTVPPPPPEKADTRLTKFNAYPEPVKRGRYVRFTGKLQIDDEGTWEGYRGKVRLYFKPSGSHKWHYVKTTKSNGSGRLYTKVKAWNSGRWRFVFAGDEDAYGDTSHSDYVRVKR